MRDYSHNLSAGFIGLPGRHTKVKHLVPWAGCGQAAVRPEDTDEDVAMLLASIELGPRVSGRLTAQNNPDVAAAYREVWAVLPWPAPAQWVVRDLIDNKRTAPTWDNLLGPVEAGDLMRRG